VGPAVGSTAGSETWAVVVTMASAAFSWLMVKVMV
jgi:hypothetical protein